MVAGIYLCVVRGFVNDFYGEFISFVMMNVVHSLLYMKQMNYSEEQQMINLESKQLYPCYTMIPAIIKFIKVNIM